MSSLSCPQHQTRSRSPAASCQPSHWRDLSTIRSTLRLVPHFPFTHLEIPKAFLVLNCPSHPAFPSIMPFSLIPKVQVFIHSPKVASPHLCPPQCCSLGGVYVCVLAQSLMLTPLCQVNPYSLFQCCRKRSLPLEATLVATITIMMSCATRFLATLPPLL